MTLSPEAAKARRRERYSEPTPGWVEHGANAYTNWGCHCDVCRKGNTEHVAAWRKRKKEEAE
jgi:hypothetical protein